MQQYISLSLFCSFSFFTGKNGPFSFVNFHPEKQKNISSRLYLLINLICTDLFRDILSHFVSAVTLQYEIKSHSWTHTGELDFLYTLLRDMCKLSPHKNGWGKHPDSKDNCTAACIERIHIESQKIWSDTRGFSKTMFKYNWKNVLKDIEEIERQVLDGHLYKKRIDDLFSTDTYFVNILASKLGYTSGIFFSNNKKYL